MPFKFIGKAVKKVVSIVSAVAGLGIGGSAIAGVPITGDLIIDGVLILGCLLIIAINGKDGIPDWLGEILKSKLSDNGQTNK